MMIGSEQMLLQQGVLRVAWRRSTRLQKAAGRLDSAHTADSSGEGSKPSPELQPGTADPEPLAIPDYAVEPPSQPSFKSEASLARNITLGKPGIAH